MGKATDSDWVILRCASRSTLKLAETLAKDGFEVWSPAETKRIRVPRANTRREVVFPLMPSYVFARAVHLVDLLQLAEMPVKPRRYRPKDEEEKAGFDSKHSDFSVLHAFGRIPLVRNEDFRYLRLLEAKRTPIKRAAYTFQRNQTTRVKEGIFGGMEGLVVRSTPKSTILCFGKGREVEFPTSLLSLDEICGHEVALSDAA